MRCGERTQQRLVPLASLGSARVAAGFRLSFEVAAVEFRQFRPAAWGSFNSRFANDGRDQRVAQRGDG
jgi:hypothetical protein